MGFILRKFILLIALAVAVSSPAMAKTSDKTKKTSKAKSSLLKKKSRTTSSRKSTTPTGKSQYKSVTVNINKADASALSAYLVGVGPVKAKAIVKYRKKNGRFSSLNDLMKVEGIGESTFKGLKKNVSTSRGKSSAPEGYVMGKPSTSSRATGSTRKKKSTRTTSSSSSSKSARTSSTSARSTSTSTPKKKKVKKKATSSTKKSKKKTKKKKSSS